MAIISPHHADKLRMFGGLRQKGDGSEGKLDFAREFLLGDVVIVSAGIEMSFPCFTLYSAVETQFHKVRQWTLLLRPIMKHALFFFFPTPPCDMNGFRNGTMQCGCIVHTHTKYIIQWES